MADDRDRSADAPWRPVRARLADRLREIAELLGEPVEAFFEPPDDEAETAPGWAVRRNGERGEG